MYKQSLSEGHALRYRPTCQHIPALETTGTLGITPGRLQRARACFMRKKLLHVAMIAMANTSSATHFSGLLCGQPLYTAANAAATGAYMSVTGLQQGLVQLEAPQAAK